MTSGRRTKAVLVMDTANIVLAAIAPDTIARRVNSERSTPQTSTEQWSDDVE
jgi:regulator of extracellular matrix RemA (YlzA/DUF370 family)